MPVPFTEAHAIERRAHRLLARSRVRSEWFDVSPAEAVGAVQRAAAACRGRVAPEGRHGAALPLFDFRAYRWDLFDAGQR